MLEVMGAQREGLWCGGRVHLVMGNRVLVILKMLVSSELVDLLLDVAIERRRRRGGETAAVQRGWARI